MLQHIDLLPTWDQYLGDLPETVSSVPSMTTRQEKSFLYNLAKNYYEGEGVIVDAGIFLGASTRCFGEGLLANPRLSDIAKRWQKPIVSFELAFVNQSMPHFFARHGVGTDLEPGGTTEPLIRQHIAPIEHLVDLRIGDVMQAEVVTDPIEICFLDLLKNQKISRFIVHNYFPRLIPGRSIVIQQDYLFDMLPFIKVHQEFFADKFRYIGEIGPSAIFLCTSAIDPDDLRRFDEALDDPAAQLHLSSIALQRSKDPARQLFLHLSHVRLVLSLEGQEAAQIALARVDERFGPLLADPHTPKRVKSAFAGLEHLCKNENSPETRRKALAMSFGRSA